MTKHTRRPLLPLALVLALSNCGGDGGTGVDTDPTLTVPASVTVTPTLDTLTWINETLQLQGVAVNSRGLQLSTPISWSSSAPAVASVNSSGLVTAVGNGTTAITARAGSVSGSATIVVRQQATSLTKVSGDAQSGQAGEILGESLVVRAADQGGTVVGGARIEWAVLTGEGTIPLFEAATDPEGHARAAWRLGLVAGSQTLEARILDSGAIVVFTASATLPEPGSVDIRPRLSPESRRGPATIVGRGASVVTAGFEPATP